MNKLYFKNSSDWREWLKNNHEKETEVWLIFFRKETGKPSMDYEAAVNEALCYGWIDSIIKKISAKKYARKFTPRKDKSKWSELNKKRVERLIKNNKMTKFGLRKVTIAQNNGQWDKSERPNILFDIPPEFQDALNKNGRAKENFEQMGKSNQKQYIGWIITAKRQVTKEKRIKESIKFLEKNLKLGLK